MALGEYWRSATARQFSGNVLARITAMVVLALATLLVARTAGAAGVGHYALLRVLTGLAGVVAAAGLPSACAFFLGGPTRDTRSLPATLTVFALLSGTAGMIAWVLVAPMVTALFFAGLPVAVVALAGTTVLSQLLVTVGRSCMQGRDDIRGSNVVFVLEEIGFLPAYVVLTATGAASLSASIVLALLAADVLGAAYAWSRLIRRGFYATPRHHPSCLPDGSRRTACVPSWAGSSHC
jgi:O-antigen/teichoic acid export membrane protein